MADKNKKTKEVINKIKKEKAELDKFIRELSKEINKKAALRAFKEMVVSK